MIGGLAKTGEPHSSMPSGSDEEDPELQGTIDSARFRREKLRQPPGKRWISVVRRCLCNPHESFHRKSDVFVAINDH